MRARRGLRPVASYQKERLGLTSGQARERSDRRNLGEP